MTKSELVEEISRKTGFTLKDTSTFVNAFTEVITEALAKGRNVTLTGFGKFYVRDRAGREGINPSTGEKIQIKPHKAPLFKAGAVLKEKVNG